MASHEALREAKLAALTEIASIVLTSLESLNESPRSTVKENLGRLMQGIENRFRTGVDWKRDEDVAQAYLLFQETAHRSATAEDAPQQQRRESRRPSPDPISPPPDEIEPISREQVTVGSLFGESDVHPGRRLPPGRPDVSSATPASEASPPRHPTVARTRQPGMDAPPRTLLAALGVVDLEPQGDGDALAVAERLCDQLRHVRHYFDKTKSNLDFIFKTLRIGVSIPSFSTVLEEALRGREGLTPYLDDLRHLWQTVVQGIWESLQPWCNDLRSSMSPDRMALEGGDPTRAWRLYQDLYPKLALYSNLMERIRVHTKAKLQNRVPGCIPGPEGEDDDGDTAGGNHP